MKTLSLDLRERILSAYDDGDGTREEIADRFRVSLGMVKKLLQQRRHTGQIGARHHLSGRKPMIVAAHHRKMRTLLGTQPDMTLKELRAALRLECSLPAIHYALGGARSDIQKKTLRASEQDRSDIAKAHRAWCRWQGGFDPARLVFLDESGAKTNLTRARGQRVTVK